MNDRVVIRHELAQDGHVIPHAAAAGIEWHLVRGQSACREGVAGCQGEVESQHNADVAGATAGAGVWCHGPMVPVDEGVVGDGAQSPRASEEGVHGVG